MAEIWGYKWTSQFGATANYDGEWANMLESLTLKEISQGLEVEKNSDEDWPSVIPVFKRNCMGFGNLDDITNLCIYWSHPDELTRRNLTKTKEAQYVIRNADYARIKSVPFERARVIVENSLKDMRKKISEGYVLPEIKKIEPEKQIPFKKQTVGFGAALEALKTSATETFSKSDLAQMKSEEGYL